MGWRITWLRLSIAHRPTLAAPTGADSVMAALTGLVLHVVWLTIAHAR